MEAYNHTVMFSYEQLIIIYLGLCNYVPPEKDLFLYALHCNNKATETQIYYYLASSLNIFAIVFFFCGNESLFSYKVLELLHYSIKKYWNKPYTNVTITDKNEA